MIIHLFLEKHKKEIESIRPDLNVDSYGTFSNKNNQEVAVIMELLKEDSVTPQKLVSDISATKIETKIAKFVYDSIGNILDSTCQDPMEPPTSQENKQFIDLIELLVKKGFDVKDFFIGDKCYPNRLNLIKNNFKTLIEKYGVELFKDEHKYPLIYDLCNDESNFEDIFPIFIKETKNLHNDTSKKIYDLLIENLSIIKDDKVRYNCLKSAIELKINFNESSEKINIYKSTKNIYKSIKTFDEFLLLKNNGCILNENDFIFNFLMQNFEKNFPIINENISVAYNNQYLNSENFLDNLKNDKLKNSDGNYFIEHIINTINQYKYSDEVLLEYYFPKSEKDKKEEKEKEKFLSEQKEKKLKNKIETLQNVNKLLNLLKNNYNFNFEKNELTIEIQYAGVLKFLIDAGFKFNFKKDNFMFYSNYLELENFKIPELICGKENVHNFKDMFYPNVIDYIFIRNSDLFKKNIESLNNAINKYGILMNKETFNKQFPEIASNKKIFKILTDSHKEMAIDFFYDKIRTSDLRYQQVSFLNLTCEFVKNNLDQEAIDEFINETCFKNSSYKLIKNVASVFGKERIVNLIETYGFNINDSQHQNSRTNMSFFGTWGELGVTTKSNYFDNMKRSDNFNDDYVKNITMYIKSTGLKDKYYSEDYFLASQYGHVINEIKNITPEKNIYCNEYVFQAIGKADFLSLAIKNLKTKYPNYNVNDRDDYGFTIADYYFYNLATNGNKEYLSVDDCSVYSLVKSQNEDVFISNCIILFKENYQFSNEMIKSISEKMKKSISEKLNPFIQKFEIEKKLGIVTNSKNNDSNLIEKNINKNFSKRASI